MIISVFKKKKSFFFHFSQIYNFIPFISSSEEQAHRLYNYVFEKTRGSCCLPLRLTRKAKASSYKRLREQNATFASQRIELNSVYNKTQMSIHVRLPTMIVDFFGFKREDIKKGKLELETTMKSAVSDVSPHSTLPNVSEFFGDKSSVTEKSFLTLLETVGACHLSE